MPCSLRTILPTLVCFWAIAACTSQQAPIATPSNMADKEALQQFYARAIEDYIREVDKKYQLHFDTLVFGKHVYNQPDDFPDIQLPEKIGQTYIQLIAPEQAESRVKANKSLFYINLIAWVEQENANFMFIGFSNGFAHQFDCSMDYTRKASAKTFDLSSVKFTEFAFRK